MLYEQLRTDLKDAMKAGDDLRKTTLRGLLSACTLELTNTNRTPQDTLSDDEVLTIIRREVKRRTDAAQQFTDGGRPELAESEIAERAILEAYLPQLMSREEIEPIVQAKIAALGVTDRSAAGKLIGAVMAELKGKADGADVKAVVEKCLS
jgi:uncharacterized protein